MVQRQLEENRFIVADLHLGEGKDNNLEYFDADKELCDFIQLIIREYGGSDAILELDFLGDTYDFLTVEYNDRILAEPKEDSAIEKIRKILLAHKEVVLALQDFVRCGGRIKFFVGNHDLPLVWVNVQSLIRRVLTDEMDNRDRMNAWKRIEFIGHREKFQEIKNGVLFIHGNNGEPANAMPKRTFLKSHLGKKILLPLLNHPYGNHLVTDLVNKLAMDTRLCKGNYWVGRLEPHWYIYLESIWKNWWFAIYTSLMWFLAPFRHRFSRRWWVRKESGFLKLFRYNLQTMLTTILNKIRGRDHTHYPKRILKENNDIDIMLSAHVHTHHYETTKHGTYANPGGWCQIFLAQFPKPELNWKRFKRLEKVLKYIWAVRKLFHKKTRGQFLPKKYEIYGFVVCRFYNDGYKEVGLMRYNPEKNCLEELN